MLVCIFAPRIGRAIKITNRKRSQQRRQPTDAAGPNERAREVRTLDLFVEKGCEDQGYHLKRRDATQNETISVVGNVRWATRNWLL
jgi:hypothetical protein